MHFSKDFGNSYHNLTNGYLEWEVGNFFPVGEKGGGERTFVIAAQSNFPRNSSRFFQFQIRDVRDLEKNSPSVEEEEWQETDSLALNSKRGRFFEFSRFCSNTTRIPFRAFSPTWIFARASLPSRGGKANIWNVCIYIYICLCLPSYLNISRWFQSTRMLGK